MRKSISQIRLSTTLHISECRDGWWLYDETQGMNLGMRAKTRDAAFVEALSYYQRRLTEVEKELAELTAKVDAFVSQFKDEEGEDD